MKVTFSAQTIEDKYRATPIETISLSVDDTGAEELADMFGRFLLAIGYHPGTVAQYLTQYETAETEHEKLQERAEWERREDRIAELEALLAEHTDILYGEGQLKDE